MWNTYKVMILFYFPILSLQTKGNRFDVQGISEDKLI